MPRRKDQQYKRDTHVVNFMIKLSPRQHEQLAKIAKATKTTKVGWIRSQIEQAAAQLEEGSTK